MTGVHIVATDEDRTLYNPLLWTRSEIDSQNLEQIWMPGIHGDIGGIYHSNFLGTISLITMIDRIKKYTNLKIDDDYLLEDFCPNLGQTPKIHIEPLITKIISKSMDVSLRKPRAYDPTKNGQMIHPIFGYFEKNYIIYKNKKEKSLYIAPNWIHHSSIGKLAVHHADYFSWDEMLLRHIK